MAVYTKKWNGSAWVTAPFKKWNGSAWVDAYVYKWNGSSWVQIYPEPQVSVSGSTVTGSGLTTYRTTYTGWSSGDAKQGNGTNWSGSAVNYGYCGINAGSYAGSGSINSVSSASFTGTRGGAGYYNNDQTIYFYRSATVPSSGTPSSSTMLGNFTATTGGPGSGGTMSNKTISGTSNVLNWLNKVNSAPYLYIYSTAAADYLSLTAVKITVSYDYASAAALFVDDGVAAAFNISEEDYTMNGGQKAYHKMPIYKDEMGLTLTEIMERREQGIVTDIDPTTVNYSPTILPWTREYKVFTDEDGTTKLKVEAMNMRMEDEAQYSLDQVNWFTLYGTGEGEYVQATMPPDFNKYSDFVYVRIIDKKKEMIMAELTVEPVIYIPDQSGIITPGVELDIDKMLGDDANKYKKD